MRGPRIFNISSISDVLLLREDKVFVGGFKGFVDLSKAMEREAVAETGLDVEQFGVAKGGLTIVLAIGLKESTEKVESLLRTIRGKIGSGDL